MSNLRQAAQQALEALEQVKAANIQKLALTQDYHDTITALRAALAEQQSNPLTEAAHKTEVAIAEAYRCGHEAGVIEEREECAKLCYSHVRQPSRLHFSEAIRARSKA